MTRRDPARAVTELPAGAVGGIGDTPVRCLRVPVRGRGVRVWLKLEGENAYGSVKARTAHGLLAALEESDLLRPGGQVVESTSGNLGIALAGLCRERGYRCTLVVDARTPAASLDRMQELGADLVTVPWVPGGDTVGDRVAAVRRLLREQPGAVWTDQYGSPDNPGVHARWTGPELARTAGSPGLDAVAAAVSSGGTLAGLARYFRSHHPATRILAVDAVGSAATGGAVLDRPFKLYGFGSGLRSQFLTPADWDLLVRVNDVHAALACRLVRDRTGLLLGGSAGAAVLAAAVSAARDPALADIACVCPDGGERYLAVIDADLARGPALDPDGAAAGLDLLASAELAPAGG
jgi:cysteine synthase